MFKRKMLTSIGGFLAVLLGASSARGETETETETVNYLTFSQGALPLAMTIDGVAQDLVTANAAQALDGNPQPFAIARQGTATTVVEIVIELPALTTFNAFSVPEVREVPSRGTTFVRMIEVLGASSGEYTKLASAELSVHPERGLTTALTVHQQIAVRTLKVRLTGGIDLPDGKATLQFSELIGNGRQAPAPLSTAFSGGWKGRGLSMELQQSTAVVTGCYDSDGGELTGTVTGNILRAVGIDPGDKVRSLFVLAVAPDGTLRGLRSTNGAPFRMYAVPRAPKDTPSTCKPRPPTLGCGAVIHSIQFDFDSAQLRAESEPTLAALSAGLAGTKQAIVILGHTSSEGSAKHNQELSQRRAQSVVGALIARGLPRHRIRAQGVGPGQPIASNADEAGRSMNRRVEVECK